MKWFSLHKLFHLLAWIIPCCIVMLLIGSALYLHQTSYQSLLSNILHSINRPDIVNRIQTEFFTETKFNTLRWTIDIVSIISIVAFFLVLKFKQQYIRFIDSLADSILHIFSSIQTLFFHLRKETKWAFLIGISIILLRSIFYATHFYIQYDEAWNYNLFLDKQFYYSIGAYNNYPLHNLVTWCFVHLFGNSVFVLRLPSIILGVSTVALLFFSIIYFFKNEFEALLITGIFACLPISIFYMMYSRGVMFEVFFAILILSSLFKSISTKIGTKQLIILALLNAMGTYSMVSHVYFIVATGTAFSIYALLKQKSLLFASILYMVFSIAFSLVLLTPMIMGTGIGPGLSAGFQQTIPSFINIFIHIHNVSTFLTGFSFLLPLFFLIHLIAIIKSWKSNSLYFLLHIIGISLLFLLVLIPLCTGSFLPERALSFLVISILIILTIPFCIESYSLQSKLIVLSIYLSLMVVFSYKSHTHNFLNWSKKLDESVYLAAIKLQENHVHQVYNDCRDFDYFIPGIEFYYKLKKDTIEFRTSSIQSTRYQKILPFNTYCFVSCNDSSSFNSNNSTVIFKLNNITIYYRDRTNVKP